MKKRLILVCFLLSLLFGISVEAKTNYVDTSKNSITTLNEVIFKDIKVENAVRKSIGLGSAEAITLEAVKKITSITFTESGNYDLSGLEAATLLSTIKVDTADKKAIYFESIVPLSTSKVSSITFLTEVDFKDISEITLLKKTLTHVRFSDVTEKNNFTFLGDLTKLSILTLGTKNNKVTVDLTPLKNISTLTRVTFTYVDFNGTLDLSNNIKLRFAEVQGTDIKDASFFNTLAPLTTVTIKNSDQLVNIDSLANTTIEDLSVSWSPIITDLTVLKTLPKLKSLTISDTNISNTDVFEELQLPLVRFYASNTKINDITFLTKMKFADKAKISVSECLLTDISSMSDFVAKPGLNISLNNNYILDFSPLAHLSDNTDIKITAHHQRLTTDAYVNEVTQLPITTHKPDEQLRYFTMAEQGIKGNYGTFTAGSISNQITWHEITPVQSPGYNRVDIANYDLLSPKTAGNISYSFRVIGNVSQRPLATYTVDFDSNGGSDVDSITITEGNLLTKPDNPTREGYTFKGWYLTNPESLAKIELIEWNFDTETVSSDMTLYANWLANELDVKETVPPIENTDKNDKNNDSKKPTTPLPSSGQSLLLYGAITITMAIMFVLIRRRTDLSN